MRECTGTAAECALVLNGRLHFIFVNKEQNNIFFVGKMPVSNVYRLIRKGTMDETSFGKRRRYGGLRVFASFERLLPNFSPGNSNNGSHPFILIYKSKLVRPIGFEPTTFGTGNQRSIQLSYGRILTYRSDIITPEYTETMAKAARAIIIENGKILVMKRNKYGSEYYTLVGGRANEGENMEQTLVREIREETGLTVIAATLVFIEKHPEPYNEQYIFLCNVAPHDGNTVTQEGSEEAEMNKYDMNTHNQVWANAHSFEHLNFRTPQLQNAIVEALRKGFPTEPKTL
jgi:ADP-ribose pyrophosphatase YjhB (NUDIX family)